MIIEHTKLNMGCGFKKLNDHWNVDLSPKCNPDQVLDFNITPWPYEDNFFDKITANYILEYLGQSPEVFTNIIKEMYRVSKDQAEWFICIPHHRSDGFYDDYTRVRALTAKTFMMFDQKTNIESFRRNSNESTFGLQHNVDLEIYDTTYNIIKYWLQQQQEGLIGSRELDMKLNTLANVAESVNIFIRVHKPCRYKDLIKTS